MSANFYRDVEVPPKIIYAKHGDAAAALLKVELLYKYAEIDGSTRDELAEMMLFMASFLKELKEDLMQEYTPVTAPLRTMASSLVRKTPGLRQEIAESMAALKKGMEEMLEERKLGPQ